MKIKLTYGRSDLDIDLDGDIQVLRPGYIESVEDVDSAILDALDHPIHALALKEYVDHHTTVAIVHTDITRATPNHVILPVLLRYLEQTGIDRGNITLINALGTHRSQTEDELRSMLGDWVVDNFTCIQPDYDDESQLVDLGPDSYGHPIKINRTVYAADLVILTGFIEPHFFAGFSGGPKAVLPGVTAIETVMANHGYDMISHPNATWGICEGNPLWEEMLEAARSLRQTFLLNVALNSNNDIVSVFSGDLYQAHKAGRDFVRKHAMVAVEKAFDIVITTNSGYPLDQNLYQSVKGMSAAGNIVRQGGAILSVVACEDGLPAHGGYAKFLKQAGSAQRVLEILAQPGFKIHDQWTVQVQARLLQKADIYVYSDGLTDEEIEQALFIPSRDIEATVSGMVSKYGPRICVLPDGPLTIAYIAG